MYIRNKKGQSTVEYVLLVTAVLTVIIAFVATKGGMFQNQLLNGLCAATQDMNTLSGTLSDSHQPGSALGNGTPGPGFSVNNTLN